MAGLIPLRLQPAASGNRTSVVLTTQNRPSSHGRHSSTGSPSPTTSGPAFNSMNATRSRAMKHVSQPILPSLPVLPYTPTEWRRTMAEIKRHHGGKRFRTCSARCAEILDHIKDTSAVEPAHLIYLHFYAANSLEMCARPLPATTPARAQLLSQAREHYDEAAALIQKAEQSATFKMRCSSVPSGSSHGSLHSPSSSVSSSTWSTPTTSSSPTSSVCSFDDMVAKSRRQAQQQQQQQPSGQPPRKAKKTVSFSLPKEEDVFKFPEPYIRPDSPTLGFDDAYFAAPITRQELPAVPKPTEIPIVSSREADPWFNRDHRMRPDDDYDSEFSQTQNRRPSLSLYRYRETLSSLKAQLESHRLNVDALLEERAAVSLGQRQIGELRRVMTSAVTAGASDEMRALDRHARIERLRQNGWQRKRFDASRYEELCNNVLAELS